MAVTLAGCHEPLQALLHTATFCRQMLQRRPTTGPRYLIDDDAAMEPAQWRGCLRSSHAELFAGLATSSTLNVAIGIALGAWTKCRRLQASSCVSWRRHRRARTLLRAETPYMGAHPLTDDMDSLPEVEAMMSELRGLEASKVRDKDAAASVYDSFANEAAGRDEGNSDGSVDGIVDVSNIERSGRVCVIGVPNSGKSSLVNALVGAKVSIVSPKPQTTRQKVLGLALLAPRPGAPPNTQAVFVDTAGIMQLSETPQEQGGPYRKRAKRLFNAGRLHQAMVKTAWKATRDVEAIFWVLDAGKCYMYGDYMPPCAELDGIAVGPPIRDAWWTHPELDEELAVMRKVRKMKKQVHVVLNKVDLLREKSVDVEQFALMMRERLLEDLGNDSEGRPLMLNLWPTSVLHEPGSIVPLKLWLCANLPQQSPIYPLAAVSDVPARVAASEVTREKLFGVLREEVPYSLAVVNAVWRETPEGKLMLGQKIVVKTEGQRKIVRGQLRHITEAAEEEISANINFGRPVELHFQVLVDARWQDDEAYYTDLQGLLQQNGSLMYPN